MAEAGTPTKKTIDSKAVRAWAFDVGDRASSLRVYAAVRWTVQTLLFPWLRAECVGSERLDLEGPMILAPVHRSNLDSVVVACFSKRRIRALGKESLFVVPVVKYFCAALGAIPVRRGQADREALAAAKSLLDRGESMIVFPEGTRQDSGVELGELFDGAAWLSARTGARVIPIGIAGTDTAMGAGAKWIRRAHVRVVVGEPLDPPVRPDGKRADRDAMRIFTETLAERLADVQRQAYSLAQ
ncbi:MAG: lysophospholipid acyltransferase family protein [Acidimicrobiales bacterium]